MLPRVRTLTVGGHSIAFRDSEGAGHPIVFLHGSGSSMDVFARQFDSATLGAYRLVAVDLPGHGASDDAVNADEVYSLRGFAAIVGAFLEAIGIRRAAVVGWSMGGHIAMELLATSEIATGVMVTGAPPIALGPLGLLRGFNKHWDVLLTSKEHFTERDEARFLTLCFGADKGEPSLAGALRRADGRVRPRFVRSIIRGEGADECRAVETSNVPVAVVNGADEPFARLSYVAGLAYGNLWSGRCHLIEGAGHAPFWQKPAAYGALLRDFLGDIANGDTIASVANRRTA